MTRLKELRKRLARLRRRRWRVRVGTAYSGLALAVLWILAAVFLVDWLFEMSQLQRAIALAVCLAVLVWAARRYMIPWLGRRETELDMALLVEREEHIDTDLVAAVQFETPEAAGWGSVALEQAVIDQVAASGKRLNVMRGVSRRQLSYRFVLLLATALLWAGAGYRYPAYLTTFLNRLLLGSRHYPTRTVIESIAVNGLDPADPKNSPVHVLYGLPVQFEVTCSGVLPQAGEARLKASRSGLATTLPLTPATDRPNVYKGQWPRLLESVTYQLYLGDAWTDSAGLAVSQLPVVEVELEVTPPAFAVSDAAAGPITMPVGLRQISVIEGSGVVAKVRSDKSLEEATITIDEQPYALQHAPAGKSDGRGDLWVLDGAGSPLRTVTAPVRYAVQVTDVDRQRLERPIEGVIRIQADLPPRIAAGIVTQYVLPTARPTVYLQALDDYGLATVSMVCEITHPDGQTEERTIDIYRLEPGKRPLGNIDMGYPFELAQLKLKKGDRMKVTLQAVDFRGQREGKTATADPLVFQVTDEQGILAGMMEADRQSATQLKTMIQRQLGIGESP